MNVECQAWAAFFCFRQDLQSAFRENTLAYVRICTAQFDKKNPNAVYNYFDFVFISHLF